MCVSGIHENVTLVMLAMWVKGGHRWLNSDQLCHACLWGRTVKAAVSCCSTGFPRDTGVRSEHGSLGTPRSACTGAVSALSLCLLPSDCDVVRAGSFTVALALPTELCYDPGTLLEVQW